MSSLVNCKTCKKLVSSSAEQCPHCGETGGPQVNWAFAGLVLFVFLIIFGREN